jgi:putative membrane protein
MTMWLDALLAYLHYAAVFLLVALMAVEFMLLRGVLDQKAVRLLGRVDPWYFGAAMATLATGFLRLVFGAKGPDFYLNSWPIYMKIGLFLAVALVSVTPTLAFIRWRRAFDHDPQWQVPADEHAKARRLMTIQVHLAALIPIFAVIMSRGLGR